MDPIIVNFSVLLGVVIGLNEVVKRLGLPEKFLPLSAVVLGIMLSTSQSISLGMVGFFNPIIVGIVVGLTSVGFYSGIKNVGEGLVAAFSGKGK